MTRQSHDFTHRKEVDCSCIFEIPSQVRRSPFSTITAPCGPLDPKAKYTTLFLPRRTHASTLPFDVINRWEDSGKYNRTSETSSPKVISLLYVLGLTALYLVTDLLHCLSAFTIFTSCLQELVQRLRYTQLFSRTFRTNLPTKATQVQPFQQVAGIDTVYQRQGQLCCY